MNNIFFHHLVGTAGNSFARALENSKPGFHSVELSRGVDGFKDQFILDWSKKLGQIKNTLFRGHNLYGLIELSQLTEKYITILRHPVERVITDWHWQKVINEKKINSNRFLLQKDFEKFVLESKHLEYYIHQIGTLDYKNNGHFNIQEYTKVSNSEAYKLAVEAINRKFSFVGITEDFDLSLFYFSKTIKIKKLANWFESSHGKTPYRPGFFDLSVNCQEILLEKTKWDTEFYNIERSKLIKICETLSLNKEFLDYYDNNNKMERSVELGIKFIELRNRIKLFQKVIKYPVKIAYVGIGKDFDTLCRDGIINIDKTTKLFDNFKKGCYQNLPIDKLYNLRNVTVDVIFITSSRAYKTLKPEVLSMIKDYGTECIVI